MAKMTRVIVKLSTEDGNAYEEGKSPLGDENYNVESITFRRDGLVSINSGAGPNCANYLICMVNPLNDKEKVYKMIPYDRMESIMFVEVIPEDKEPDLEVKRA